MLGRTVTTDRHYARTAASQDAPSGAVGICRLHGVTFFASWANLGPTPYPAVAPDQDKPEEMLYLYHCGGTPQ
jgi:hypothetical protein